MRVRRPNRDGLIREAFAFARWAASVPKPPTWQEIQGFLQCNSVKARRWRRLWLKTLPGDTRANQPPSDESSNG